MKLGNWPKFQKLHIHSLSIPGGWNWAYFALRAAVSKIRPIFKIAIFGQETWQVAKVPEKVPELVSDFAIHKNKITTLVEIFSRSIHKIWGVNLVCTRLSFIWSRVNDREKQNVKIQFLKFYNSLNNFVDSHYRIWVNLKFTQITRHHKSWRESHVKNSKVQLVLVSPWVKVITY